MESGHFPPVPLVILGSSFTKVQDYLKRFESIADNAGSGSPHSCRGQGMGHVQGCFLKGTVISTVNPGD